MSADVDILATAPRLDFRVGCEFRYESSGPTPAIMLVEPRLDTDNRILQERWDNTPELDSTSYLDRFGNRCRRFVLPAGPTSLRFDALVDITSAADPVVPDAIQHPIEDLPDEVLIYLLTSRYCLSDILMREAWDLFGSSPPGWGRVQAVCDWIHTHIRYGVPSTPRTTAVDVFLDGGGMCRDFAHLAVTFCRALSIPARYVSGYISDIDDPGPPRPMDFHAWFEVFLSNQWWAFDARFNTPRVGRVPIAYGRDAVDVAMVTTFGPATFKHLTVWAEVPQAPSQKEAVTT